MIPENRNILFDALGIEASAIANIRATLKAQMVAGPIVGATDEQESAMISEIDISEYNDTHAEVLRIAKATKPEPTPDPEA
jgi:hypothetical protein